MIELRKAEYIEEIMEMVTEYRKEPDFLRGVLLDRYTIEEINSPTFLETLNKKLENNSPDRLKRIFYTARNGIDTYYNLQYSQEKRIKYDQKKEAIRKAIKNWNVYEKSGYRWDKSVQDFGIGVDKKIILMYNGEVIKPDICDKEFKEAYKEIKKKESLNVFRSRYTSLRKLCYHYRDGALNRLKKEHAEFKMELMEYIDEVNGKKRLDVKRLSEDLERMVV